MIPCINQATVLTTNTKKFLELSRSHNFTHVELDIGKVEEYIAKDGKAALKNSLVDNKITLVSLNAIENYPILTEDEMKKSLRRCREIIELSNSLNCKMVVVNPNEVAATERVLMQRKFDEFMIETAKIAEAYDVQVGFEYVSYDNRIINSLAQSLSGLTKWNCGVGLVLDVFHMYRSGEMVAEIPVKDRRLLWVVHVNDAPEIPIPGVRDSDRAMPLEGVINLRECITQLHTMEFDGPVSVELFNKKYWEMDPDQAIEKARISLMKLGV
jgi:2-keto-myo-inositol isomerase